VIFKCQGAEVFASGVLYADLSGNELASLAGVEPFLNIQVLIANDNLIESLDGVFSLVSLRKLSLSNNFLTGRLAPGAGMAWDMLTDLDVSCNSLASLEGVGYLPSLRRLNGSCNELVELPLEIGSLRFLESLSVQGNRLRSLNGLKRCPALAHLNAMGNGIAGLKGVVAVLRSIPALREVVLLDNPVAAELHYTVALMDIPQLRNVDGAEVGVGHLRQVVLETRDADLAELEERTRARFAAEAARLQEEVAGALAGMERQKADAAGYLEARLAAASRERDEALQFLEKAKARGRVDRAALARILHRDEDPYWHALGQIDLRAQKLAELDLDRLLPSPVSQRVPEGVDELQSLEKKGANHVTQRYLPKPSILQGKGANVGGWLPDSDEESEEQDVVYANNPSTDHL
jgi:hypothetical protein